MQVLNSMSNIFTFALEFPMLQLIREKKTTSKSATKQVSDLVFSERVKY